MSQLEKLKKISVDKLVKLKLNLAEADLNTKMGPISEVSIELALLQ